MPFPDSPRVVYRKNPLVEVICQVRFPPILRIDSEPPAGFQEKIRAEYPFYVERPGSSLPLPSSIPAELAKLVRKVTPAGTIGDHKFTSSDENWSATLTRDFLTLKTTTYRRWEEFRERIGTLLDALYIEYRPAFFSRVGLRYVDVILRSEIGLGKTPWSDLLNPYVAGELSAAEIEKDITHAAREVVIRLNKEGEQVTIRHGIAVAEPTPEQCFLIDSDFHVEGQMEKEYAINILDQFNRQAGRLFRWCIQDRLHTALEPQSPDN
ncbi:MAG: TIGR04255 family protein [Phycisphaerae bacterium]|nr:TIGR04255 family protein [Phycisphaerae bacterium]